MKKLIRSLPVLVLAVVLLVWIVNNRHRVAVDLFPLPYELAMPLFIVLFAGIFVGLGLVGWTVLVRRVKGAADKHALKREVARLQSRIKDLENQLEDEAPKAQDHEGEEKRALAKPSSGA